VATLIRLHSLMTEGGGQQIKASCKAWLKRAGWTYGEHFHTAKPVKEADGLDLILM